MIRTLTLCTACIFACGASAQSPAIENAAEFGGSGGGEFGGGGFGMSVPSATGIIQSAWLTVVVPDSKDAVLALGSKGWVKQKLNKQEGLEIVPVVAAGSVAVRYGDKMYAFSVRADRWDAVDLLPNSEAVPVVSHHMISAREGDLYHAFALPTGRWSTVNLKTGEVN